ncbi:MAG: efflux RND transporter periplasmic adaptor subunit [Patescibacteria group bacterium]|nr:efflux RND transporter periplasmic adaptor subunit [Patescibacteria group bacterium]
MMKRLDLGRRWPRIALAVLVILGVTVGLAAARWSDLVRWAGDLRPATTSVAQPDGEHGTAHDGAHEAAGPANSLEVSQQGRRSIGLTMAEVALRDFSRTIVLPGVIVERQGRSESTVSVPVTGIVTHIHPIRGGAVRPGDPLFELRLTHEDIVEKQSSLLRAVEELDVLKLEVTRLEQVAASGALAGKTLLERRYEQQRLEAALRADKQALVLHGLTEEQVASIIERRTLLPSLTLAAPPFPSHCTMHDDFYEVAQIFVKQGDHVVAGAPLATLADYCELYIEGRAFEHDTPALSAAIAEESAVSALVEGGGGQKTEVAGLKLLYVEGRVDPDSRAQKFYVALPNEMVRNETMSDGHRFIAWRYRPGQRVEVLLPVERWPNRIVLPVAAVVQDGVESFVFLQRGNRFERTNVHVEHRDAQWAVLANDGSLFPGDLVAATGAYQIHLALKAKAGGGPDPHAGHGH